ncbi:MAG: hypothetical protein ACR2PK_15365 [Acidimicrobiales bacterium]
MPNTDYVPRIKKAEGAQDRHGPDYDGPVVSLDDLNAVIPPPEKGEWATLTTASAK